MNFEDLKSLFILHVGIEAAHAIPLFPAADESSIEDLTSSIECSMSNGQFTAFIVGEPGSVCFTFPYTDLSEDEVMQSAITDCTACASLLVSRYLVELQLSHDARQSL